MFFSIADKYEEPSTYHIYFQRQEVVECDNFVEAVEITFALYFIFNISFPKDISCFLETIQRYFLKIHPDMCRSSSIAKNMALRLLNKLREVI